MTKFDKNEFSYHGGYLMYHGDYEGCPIVEDGPNVHPTRVGTRKALFVARFKYNKKDKAGFMKFLMKNFSVEEYAEMMKEMPAPLSVLKSKGYVSKSEKDFLKKSETVSL